MRQDLTDITIILDRSGSMATVKSDVIGGVNEFIKRQREAPGQALLTLVQFDDVYEHVYHARPVSSAPLLTESTYHPRGMTALHDSLCRAIDETGARLRALPEAQRPALVIVVIQTDGLENASRIYSLADVHQRITQQRDVYRWQFVYLGANQDAMAEGVKLGVDQGYAAGYSPLRHGHTFSMLSEKIVATRAAVNSGESILVAAAGNLAYTADEREELETGE